MINIYKEIEDFILNEIVSIHGEKVKTIIENLPISKKRIVMFSCLCSKKDTQLVEMIKTLEGVDRMSKIDKIINNIRTYIGVGDVEKKSFGEVFTSLELVNEMLDTLPKEVWSNPNLKWLDPANGVGNFPIIIIQKLMIGLKEWEPNEEKRYKHIIENMIYVSELQIKNMFLWMMFVDPKNEFKINIFRGSFLSPEFDSYMKNEWNIQKFDIIIGNPPYQDVSESKEKGSNQSRKKLWMIFSEKSLELCNKLLFITPNNWLYKTCYLYEIYQKFLKFAEIDTEKLNDTYFKGVGSTFSYYLLDKNNLDDTKISVNGEIFSKKINICPTKNISNISLNIFDKVFNHNLEHIYMIREKYEQIKNIDNVLYIERSKSKGVLSGDKNIYDTTSYWLEIENDVDRNNLKNLLNSNLYKFCIKNLRSGMAIVSSINFLPKINAFVDIDIYKFFNLTQEEIDLIEKTK